MPSSARERENLNSSIRSSFERRQAIDLELPKDMAESHRATGTRAQRNERPADMDNSNKLDDDRSQVIAKGNVSEPPRDPRDQAAPLTPPSTLSRPASPYTLNPPIDFDGLSWPSMLLIFLFISD
jgi:GTP cyclohydrolase I